MIVRLLVLLVSVVTLALAPPASAKPPGEIEMTVTLVRHGQSEGNASGLIDTSIPGPPLTPLGQQQAKAAARLHAASAPDAVFASPLLRTRQTAQYLADEVALPVQIQDGFREVEGGDLEGRPEADVAEMIAVLTEWIRGNRTSRIPGSIDGNELDARFDSALEAVRAGGYTNPVVYSHGAAITAWTLMNVENPPAEIKGLGNTGYVIVRGSPTTGWTLVDWVEEPPA